MCVRDFLDAAKRKVGGLGVVSFRLATSRFWLTIWFLQVRSLYLSTYVWGGLQFFQVCVRSCWVHSMNAIASLARLCLTGSSRAIIYLIIIRLSVDTLIGQMSRFLNDDKFQGSWPDWQSVALQPSTKHTDRCGGRRNMIRWGFCQLFLKSNFCQSSFTFFVFSP